MALTNQQVQQAYLSVLGRPAEGDAVLWGSLATDVPGLINTIITIRNGVDFNKDNTIFVQNLYENLLGRTGDDEGLSFWVAALNAGMNHGELVTSFISSAAQTLNDLYTIQNKLALAEQISTQIKTIKGGAPAEAKLKALMNTIDDKTSINDIQEDINHFIGQFNEAKKVTVKPGADEPTIGSDEHASTYNATVNLNDEKTNLNIEGSTSFDDTLNLTVKGSSSNNTFNSSDIGQLSNLNTINLNLKDSRITNSNITTSDLGAQNLKIKGTSADNITVNTQMSLLDTGDGGDTLSVNKSVESIKTGKGNDKVTINAKVGTLDTSAGNDNIKVNAQVNSIDAGSGNDIINLAAGSKINKLNAGAGDDIISISQKANITNALIDGGAGFNSLKLYDGLVDLTKTTLSGINALSGEARLKLSQIGAQNFILGVERLDNFAEPTGVFDTAKLEIKAEQGSMDLSKLAIAEDSTGHELKILDVKNSAIKLNDNNLGNSDGSDSTKVSVYGTDGNDTITIESGKVSLLDSLKGNDTITISQAASVAILNANDGKNTIKIAGKVGALTTKSGDDNISVSGEASTINTNDGNDIINISGKVNSLDTGAGNDTISVSGQVSKELNAGSGNDTININQGARIRDLKAGDGNDIISIQKGADINNAKIDGGSGFNSLKLLNGEVNLSKTSLNNISAISGEAKLSANQVNNKSLTLGTEQKDNYGDPSGVFDSATLNIQADKADLSLNNLKIASGSKNHTINIQNAKESQISLNDKNLGNDGIDDVEVFASKVNVAGSANKDKITLKEGKFASLNAGDGNDIINIEKGASLAKLNADDGNDTINVKGKVSELNANNGDDVVVLDNSAEVKKLNAGAGDDIIRVKNGAKIDLIDGNTGNDTLAFDKSSGSTSQTPTDISKTTISNIEILDGEGVLSAKQINGQSFILGGDKNKEVDGQKLSGNAKLQVKSDDLTNINLANLKSQTGVKDNTIEVQDVSEGKITLSDAKQYIKETIKLTANAHSVDISNIKGGDKIDFTNIQNLNGTNNAAQSPEALDNTSKTISSSKLYTINLVDGSVDDLSSLDSTLSAYSVSSNANALLAINQNGKAHIFKVNGPSTTSKLNSNMLKLLAITDSEINLGTTTVKGNTIELNGSVTITINKGDTKVQSAGNADTVFVGSVDLSQADQGTPNNKTEIIGSKDFTDTLAIQITSGASTGGTTQKLDKSNFDKIVDTSKVKDVENLTLSTGNVEVDLTLENTNGNFQNEVTIAGSGTTKLQVKQDTQKISLGSGSGDVTVSSASVGDLNLGGGQNTLKVENSGKIGEVTGSNEKDTITISGSSSQVDKITTNGGADEIKLENAGTLKTLEASKGNGSDEVTISGSGSISNITGEGKVKIGDNTTLNNTLDIGDYKAELTISGSSAKVKELLADDNKIKLEANSQIEKLQIKDGGKVEVSGSGSVTLDTTNDTGTHTLTVGQDTTLKTFTAGSGDDTITIANGGKLSGDKIGLTNGNNTLNIASGGNVTNLTTITTGNGTNKITIDKDATASKLATINLGNGTNTLDLGVSGVSTGLTVSGGSGTDNINLSGTNGKITTLNAGANSTNISLKDSATIDNIKANEKGSTINIASGTSTHTIKEIAGDSGADSISVGKNITISEIKTGTGAISIDGEGTISKVTATENATGNINIGQNTKTTVNELIAGKNTANQTINFDKSSVITTLKAASGGTLTLNGNGEVSTLDLTGNTTENITIANGASVKNFTTDANGNDNITVANGGKFSSGTTLNFSGGNDKLEVQSGGDISTITTITMGDGSGSVTLKDGAKADKLATINLGNGDNTLDLGISGAANGITVSGGSGTDTIKVSGAGKITTLNAGANKTDITLEKGGSISTINANNTASSTIEVSGSGYIDKIAGNTQDDIITLGKDITVGTIDAGVNKTTTINGGNITTLSAKSTGNVAVKVDQKANIKTIDTSSTAGAVTISGASTVDSLTVAGEVTISCASTVNNLTTTGSGDITLSGTGTTLKNDLNGKSGANNKITIADGAKVDGTIKLDTAKDSERNGGTNSGDVVNISGANTVVNKIDTGSGAKTITIENNATINTIDAGHKKNDILLSGSGTVKELITGDTTSNDTHKIQIGGDTAGTTLSVEKFTAGTGKDEITVASGGKISNQEINLNNGDNTFSVSGDISGANKILTGSGANTITLSDGAKLKDNVMVDFSNAGDTKTSTLAMNASGSISVTASKNTTISVSGANTGADAKAKIDTLKAGTGETTINLTDNAKIKTINANDAADSTITVSGTGTIENISGSDTKDTINIKDAGSSITNLNAGAGETDVVFSGGATVTNLNVSQSGSDIKLKNTTTTEATITKLITTGTGTHKIDVDNKVKIAGFEAGSGDDSITVKSGGTISASSLDFKSGANTLDLKSGASIVNLTSLKMGDGGNANLTIEDGVTLGTGTLSIELGSAGTGTTDKNTFTLKASGDKITLSGSSSLDEITVAGNNAKLGTLNAGTGTTQITLNNNASIDTINAKDTEGGTINISGSGSITTIVGKSGADTITLSKDIKVTTYTGGTGDDNINLSGATITTLDTNTGNTTISGDTANQGTVNELKTTSGDSHTITVSNATIKKYTAGQKDDTLIVSSGGVIGDTSNKTLDLGSGSNTLTIKSGGNISALDTIKMGDGGNANITIEKGATLGTTTINLGTAATTNGKNTFTLYASGDNLSLSGSSSMDEITISGNGINLNKLSAGSGDTTINLESNGGIKTLELGNDANNITINGSGGVSTITATGSSTHTLTIGDKATISSYTGGSGNDTITIGSGANINVTSSNPSAPLNITTGSGDDTITIEKGAKFGSNVTIDFTANGSGTLKLKGANFDLTQMDQVQGSAKNALSVKNVTKIDLTEATGNINFGGNSGATTTKTTNGEVEITGVKSKDSTITLSDKAHEKVTLESGAKGITILSVGSGDKIDFSKVSTELSTAISSGTFSSVGSTGTSTTISSSGAYVWNDGISNFDQTEQVKTQIQTAASSLTTGQKALVAVKNNDQSKSAIYLVSGSGTGNNDITLDLLGIVGHKIDNQDKLGTSGVIEFA